MKQKTYNFEDRLVHFAADVINFCKTLPPDATGNYYSNQLLRSSGSAALHYGEAQGTTTTNDFIHKVSNTLKELRESRVTLKILDTAVYGSDKLRKPLHEESMELSAISATMILNKKRKNQQS
jgi:four helix bundle protein